MDHTEQTARKFNRERERGGYGNTLVILKTSSDAEFVPHKTITTDWYPKRVTKLSLETIFEIKIAESAVVKDQVGVVQVETATVVGTITAGGNASVTVTAEGIGNSPKAISVLVLLDDNASTVAGKIRFALEDDEDVEGFFNISGVGANIILTAKTKAVNDETMNVAIANGTCTGLTAAPMSADTVEGEEPALQAVFDDDISHCQVDDRFYKFKNVDEPNRQTRCWLVSCEPTGQKKPA